MSMEHRIARLAPRSASQLPSTGGKPELTSADIAAALGFTGKVPDSCIGIHLVMARYADDAISLDTLQRILSRLAWSLWYDLGITSRISREQIQRLVEIAMLDYTEPGRLQGATPTTLAKLMPVDPRTWMAGLGRVYGELMQRISDHEAVIFRILYRVLARD